MNPDYIIEDFWLNFKESMINFYIVSKIPSRPIEMWSNELNWQQALNYYSTIECNIKNYITLYAIDVMRFNSPYHFGILNTNIKRWNSISADFKLNDNDTNKYHNIVFLLIDMYRSLVLKKKPTEEVDDINEIGNLFNMIELYIIYEDFTLLIKFAVDNNKPSILDKLSKYCNIGKYIDILYKVKITNQSGKKILELIKRMNKSIL